MAKSNSSTSIESLVGSLVAAHVDSLLRNLVTGSARPIAEFALDGDSVFVVYGASGAPLGYGGSRSAASAASRNLTRRLVGQLASTGMVTSYRTIAMPSDSLVGIIGRMIGGLLGEGVLKIGDGIGDAAVEGSSAGAPGAARRAGRPRGASKGGRKGRARRSSAVDSTASEAAVDSATGAPRRGRKPRSTNPPAATSSKRGPGRPRKTTDEGTPSPARRRGRPGKSDAAQVVDGAPVKRRGRPARNADSATPTAPKRRGRPPGSKIRGAGKGRQRHNPVEATATMVGNG